MEDYLEAILILGLGKRPVRVRDVSRFLRVKTSSVANAIKVLSGKQLVHQEPYGYIELTQKGILTAKKIYEKHKTLFKFLHELLGIDSTVAERDACRIEHHIHPETLDRILKFIAFVEGCPEGEPLWLSSFHYYAKHGEKPGHCDQSENMLKGDTRMKSLSTLQVGERCRVTRIVAGAEIKRRLLEMGIVPGVEIEVQKVAPLGDPVDVLVKGYHLSLRREEAKSIGVEVSDT
jgi:DtxR family Mn-dependent transcriptional regulator